MDRGVLFHYDGCVWYGGDRERDSYGWGPVLLGCVAGASQALCVRVLDYWMVRISSTFKVPTDLMKSQVQLPRSGCSHNWYLIWISRTHICDRDHKVQL